MPLNSQAPTHQYVRSIVLGVIECVREKNFSWGGGVVEGKMGSRSSPFEQIHSKSAEKNKKSRLGSAWQERGRIYQEYR